MGNKKFGGWFFVVDTNIGFRGNLWGKFNVCSRNFLIFTGNFGKLVLWKKGVGRNFVDKKFSLVIRKFFFSYNGKKYGVEWKFFRFKKIFTWYKKILVFNFKWEEFLGNEKFFIMKRKFFLILRKFLSLQINFFLSQEKFSFWIFCNEKLLSPRKFFLITRKFFPTPKNFPLLQINFFLPQKNFHLQFTIQRIFQGE